MWTFEAIWVEILKNFTVLFNFHFLMFPYHHSCGAPYPFLDFRNVFKQKNGSKFAFCYCIFWLKKLCDVDPMREPISQMLGLVCRVRITGKTLRCKHKSKRCEKCINNVCISDIRSNDVEMNSWFFS